MWVAQNAIQDSQTAIDLLINCFLGNVTLYHFLANSDVKMLSQGFIESFLLDPISPIEKALNDVKEAFAQKMKSQQKDEEFREMIQRTRRYIQSYNGALKVFFIEEKAKYLYSSSKSLLQEIITVLYFIMENCEGEQTCHLIHTFVKLCKTTQIKYDL